MTAQLLPDMTRTASISACGRYASKADAEVDDPTIGRCIGFSKREGMGGLVVVNLFALRSRHPDKLLTYFEDCEGPENATYQARWLTDPDVDLAIAAWGAHRVLARKWKRWVASSLTERAQDFRRPLHCLGKTQGGAPRHPLYLPKRAPLEVFA